MTYVQIEVPTDKLALYAKLIGTNPSLEFTGARVPYTSLNAHMISYLLKTETLVLRVPEDERESFLEKYQTVLCRQYGVVQKEYVEVPDAHLQGAYVLGISGKIWFWAKLIPAGSLLSHHS